MHGAKIKTSMLTYVAHPKWVLKGKMAVDRDRFMLHVCTAESPHAEIEGNGEKNGVITTDYSDTKKLGSPTN